MGMEKGDLKGISLFIHLAYIVYKNIQPHVEKRSMYAHFTRLEVEYRLTNNTDDSNKKFENKRESNIDF